MNSPEWFASQAYARTLPLVAVIERWVEMDPIQLEAAFGGFAQLNFPPNKKEIDE